MTVNEALAAVVTECPDGYAKAYAQPANCLHAEQMDPVNGLKDQVTYVLSNMQHWRGDRAKEVKAVLKQFVQS